MEYHPDFSAPDGRYYSFLHNKIKSYRLLGNLLFVNENWADPLLDDKDDTPDKYIRRILFPFTPSNKNDHKEFETKLRDKLKISDCDKVNKTLAKFKATVMISGSRARLSPKSSFSHCGGKLIKVGTDMQDPYTDRSKTHTYPAADWIEITNFHNNATPDLEYRSISSIRYKSVLDSDEIVTENEDDLVFRPEFNSVAGTSGKSSTATYPVPSTSIIRPHPVPSTSDTSRGTEPLPSTSGTSSRGNLAPDGDESDSMNIDADDEKLRNVRGKRKQGGGEGGGPNGCRIAITFAEPFRFQSTFYSRHSTRNARPV
eukprot:GHVL01022240.1.p1 GENE.GHVL01022240.1~~GHVL01022240.1.p1  ORF type:complete len:314 (+),score=42.27 GHVL01022240.1:344-1285(+)